MFAVVDPFSNTNLNSRDDRDLPGCRDGGLAPEAARREEWHPRPLNKRHVYMLIMTTSDLYISCGSPCEARGAGTRRAQPEPRRDDYVRMA